jgi:hypothetical protein
MCVCVIACVFMEASPELFPQSGIWWWCVNSFFPEGVTVCLHTSSPIDNICTSFRDRKKNDKLHTVFIPNFLTIFVCVVVVFMC